MPKGRGVIKRGRTILIDAEFEDGLPANNVSLVNRKGESLNLGFNHGVSESCVFVPGSSKLEGKNLHATLHFNQLIPSRDHLLLQFEAFKHKKTFNEQLEDFKKGRPSKFDGSAAASVLETLAQTLIGRHQESKVKQTREKSASKTMKLQLKDLGVSESSSDDERDDLPRERDAVFNRKERLQKFVHEQIEDRMDKLLIYRDIIIDKREKRKKPDEDFATFVSRSKESIEVSDPFGYIHDVLYNAHSDRIFYNKGSSGFKRHP